MYIQYSGNEGFVGRGCFGVNHCSKPQANLKCGLTDSIKHFFFLIGAVSPSGLLSPNIAQKVRRKTGITYRWGFASTQGNLNLSIFLDFATCEHILYFTINLPRSSVCKIGVVAIII